jgi:CxxC motif-containing protein
MTKELICICCPQGCRLTVSDESGELTVTGNTCKRGIEYGKTEATAPTRVITTTVAVTGSSWCRLPVKTAGGVPKSKIFDCMDAINQVTVQAPVHTGDVVLSNILGTGVDVVAARTIE